MNPKRKISTFISFILLVAASAFSVRAAGEPDPNFSAFVSGNTNGNIYVIKTQPNGKILIGGIFTEANGFAASAIARLNADGTPDTSFKAPDFFNGFGVGVAVYAIAVQPDGKILVGGTFAGIDGIFKSGVRRLNSDGSIDTAFNVQQIIVGDYISDIKLQPDGKILISGYFSYFSSGGATRTIDRLNSDGTRDSGFNPSVSGQVNDIALQPDGKILAATGQAGVPSGTLVRLNADGSTDNSFTTVNTNGRIEAVEIQSDGKVVFGGDFSTANNFAVGRIARVNTNSSLDLFFNLGNAGADFAINDISIRADGKIFIGGEFGNYNSTARQKIAQLNADGTLDTAFPDNVMFLSSSVINDVEVQSDGKWLVGANYNQTVLSTPSFLRFNINGTLESEFRPRVTRFGKVNEILQQPDGKILIGGDFLYVGSAPRNALARLESDGSLETSFVPFIANSSLRENVTSLALQADGRILVGTTISYVPFRLNPNGTQSLFTAAISGHPQDIVVPPSGDIIYSGDITVSGNPRKLGRLIFNGGVDFFFGPDHPNDTVYRVIVQSDGKYLVAGKFTLVGTFTRNRIARLNADSSIDQTFHPPGGANGTIYDMDVQPDGKIVVVGDFTTLNGSSTQVRIGRLNSDGSLDSTFAANADATVLAVKIQPDRKILVGGSFGSISGAAHNKIARLFANGAVEAAFNPSANGDVSDIVLQSDNNILIGGSFTKINGISNSRAARLLNFLAPRAPFDYDGDGVSDISVFRPATNRWYIFKSSNAVVFEETFGTAGDTIAPADYDGDGKTDIAIYRGSTGDWYSISSITNTWAVAHWGQNGDIPRPSDFDADGKADYIVFRPSSSGWYRLGSTGAISINVFGIAGDKPVSGDFDGDGKADLAIFRPSDGNWWWLSSGDSQQRAVQWGISTDIPAPADYDADGKTDFAVYRPSTGVWYIINSGNGSFTIFQFGIAEDKPVPGDYDGDGRADIAVFRPSTGTWYQQKTLAGFAAQQFGVGTDIPTENAFVP